jgi:hypothetical protein
MDLGMREEIRTKGMSGVIRFTASLVSTDKRRLTSKSVPSMSEQMSLHSMNFVFGCKYTSNHFIEKYEDN